jgi:thioredoxin 2
MTMIRTCAQCGQQNRVAARHLADTGRCGACKAELPPAGQPLDVGTSEFDEIVAGARVPVLVDFWAAWCGPCRMVAPEVKKAAALLAGQALVLKVDTDQHPDLASRFGVQGIPNFVVLSQGQAVAQEAGAMSHQKLAALVARASVSA